MRIKCAWKPNQKGGDNINEKKEQEPVPASEVRAELDEQIEELEARIAPYIGWSSRRFKEVIEDMRDKSEVILSLRPVSLR